MRNAISLWADRNTRPETLERRDMLHDKVRAVTSFFDFAAKHPGQVTTEIACPSLYHKFSNTTRSVAASVVFPSCLTSNATLGPP